MRKLYLTLVTCLAGVTAFAQFGNPLFIPDTLSGTTFNLTVDESYMQFLPGDSTLTYGINAPYLGPTIILRKGDFVQMNVTNLLDDTTTMHWHGMHVAPEDDGGPHTKILPGETWSPDFTVLDEATTYWYHPHLHTKTAQQVYNGAAGMLIVRDDAEAALDLPRTYGVDDFPIILQDKTFDDNNQLIFAALADTMMVNGTLSPYLEVPAQRVRFRFLNASNQRVYNVQLPASANPLVIGSDGGLLEHPVPIDSLIMAPGERFEVVFDFTGNAGSMIPMGSNSSKLPVGSSGGPGGPGGPPGNMLDNSNFDFLEIRVVPPAGPGAGPVPFTLNSHTIWDEQDAAVTRLKRFDTLTTGFPFYINGTAFDHMVINDTVYLNDIEVWTIRNETNVAHPFHIHDVQFFILDINSVAPPPHLAGRKDVVLINVADTVRFIAKFEDHSDEHIPYMYHCHNLFHEDAGMMGQFLVLDTTTTGLEAAKVGLLGVVKAYPNPATETLTIAAHSGSLPAQTQVRVVDLAGREVPVDVLWRSSSAIELGLSAVAPGVYTVVLSYPQAGGEVIKVLKH